MSRFRQAIADYIRREAKPVDKFGHQPRLYALTLQVGLGLTYDDDVVYAAAWLHDLGVFVGHRPEEPALLAGWDHVAYTCKRVPQILAESDFPAAKVPAVLAAIRTHQPRDMPESIEATILRDADILEQLGAVGVLRAVAKVGRDSRYPGFTEAVQFLERSYATLPAAIRLESTRALAAPRLALLRSFLDAAQLEANGALY